MKSAARKSMVTGVCGLVTAAGLMAMVGGMGGCVSYASYPAVAQNTATNDPNTPAMEEVMMAGLRWVVNKYPPGPVSPTGEAPETPTDIAVNLPPGVKPAVYLHVASAVPGGHPLTARMATLPTYHVGGIRIRGDEASLWVFRPAVDLGQSATGGPVYQEVRVWLRGGFQPWHVVSSLESTPGTGEMPELSYYTPEPPPTVHAAAPADSTYKPSPRAQPTATGQEQAPPGGDEPRMDQPEPLAGPQPKR